jgi:hypothetical protein
MSSQNTIGVAKAPMIRWRWRRKRTSSRLASESAGSISPGAAGSPGDGTMIGWSLGASNVWTVVIRNAS